MECVHVAEDRDKWQAIFSTVMGLWVA